MPPRSAWPGFSCAPERSSTPPSSSARTTRPCRGASSPRASPARLGGHLRPRGRPGPRRWPRFFTIAGENPLVAYLMAPFLLSLFALLAPLLGGASPTKPSAPRRASGSSAPRSSPGSSCASAAGCGRGASASSCERHDSAATARSWRTRRPRAGRRPHAAAAWPVIHGEGHPTRQGHGEEDAEHGAGVGGEARGGHSEDGREDAGHRRAERDERRDRRQRPRGRREKGRPARRRLPRRGARRVPP